MSEPFVFKVRKMTDRELMDSLRKLIDEKVLGFEGVNVNASSIGWSQELGANWESNGDLQHLLATGSTYIQRATFKFSPNTNLSFTRDANNPIADSLSATSNPSQLGRNDYLRFLEAARRHFGEVTPRAWELSALGQDIQAHYQAREAALQRQELTLSTFFSEMQQFTQKLTKEHQERMQELERGFTEKQEHLAAEHKARMEALDAREDALKKKESAFETRESKYLRRALRDDLKKELKARSTTFELTKGTRQMRRPVWIATVVIAALLAGTAGWLLFTDIPGMTEGTRAVWLMVRQITFTVGALAFAAFFIRWSNRWFQQHADEEFKLKRLDLDIDRASWLVEMALEWRKENQADIPPELLKGLAKNLFNFDAQPDMDINPAETLASAIFGVAAKVKIHTPGAEVEIDRKGVKELEKQGKK